MRVINIELDEDFLKRFYDLTGDKVPDTITLVSLKKQVLSIKERFKIILSSSDGSSYLSNEDKQETEEIVPENVEVAYNEVLLIDSIGVITYQVQRIMNKLGFNLTNVKDIYGALSIFEDNNFNYIIMDLQIPTEREGFILYNELRKMAQKKGINPTIGILSVAGNKELKQDILDRGADFYVEKSENWQQRLKDIMAGYKENQKGVN